MNEFDFSWQSNHNQWMYYAVVIPLMWAAILVSCYVAFNTPSVDGTGFYFLLPLSFAFCCLLFGKDLIAYQNGGMALKVFYTIVFIRYVVLPFLTCWNGHFAQMTYSPAAYRYSIFIQIIELVVSCITLKLFYERIFDRVNGKIVSKDAYYEELSIGGVFVLVFAFALLVLRGWDDLMSSMRFLIVDEKLGDDSIYSYDIWAVHTLLAFVPIVVTGIFQRRNDEHPSGTNMVIPLLLVVMSIILTFGNNRMMIVYFAVSGLSMLLFAFPHQKKIIFGILVPAFVIVIVSFTMMKQFGINVSGNDQADVGQSVITETVSEYISSTESIARTYDMYSQTGDQMHGLRTVWADVVDKTTILGLPFLKKAIEPSVKDISPSYRLAMTGSEVVPMAGQTLYYGTYYLGWFLDVLVFILLMLLLSLLEAHSKLNKTVGRIYLFTWMSVIVAMAMCYNLGIMYHAFTYVPFFVFMALSVNNTVRINKNIISDEQDD